MQDSQPGEGQFHATDDGFRNADLDDPFVVWDYLDPHAQTIFYLHGALHLYRDAESANLQKLTWIRTGEALIDQIRAQLAADRFPLIITEGSSAAKLVRIRTSDYLSKGLRSLAAIGGSLLVFGLSMAANDAHIMRAVARSKVKRVAVSVFGDPSSAANLETIEAANTLIGLRQSVRASVPLDVEFFDAATLPLWNSPS